MKSLAVVFSGMKKYGLGVYICISFFIFSCSQRHYSVANAHAHNDYEHPVPFYTAWNAGYGSIEADVFVAGDSLYVAHNKKDIQLQRSLYRLYIAPLAREMATDSSRKLHLLVDIKADHERTLSLLASEMRPLMPWLSTMGHPNRLTLVITGNRPAPEQYSEYPLFFFFDDDLKLAHNSEEWARVAQVSLPFNKLSDWKGDGPIARSDKQLIRHKIDSVHASGKTIRFWAAPDTTASWKLQKKLKADFIGTDKIEELSNWLRVN